MAKQRYEYWNVPRDWPGETVFIVGGGTSLIGVDLSVLRGRRVIALNTSWEDVPFADLLMFADVRWWNLHQKKIHQGFKGQLATTSQLARGGPELLRLRVIKSGEGLATATNSAVYRRTVLQPAINVAVHRGAARVALLGIDMTRMPTDLQNGRTHHHKPHPWNNRPGNKSWDMQMEELKFLVQPLQERGIPVVNLSAISRIPWWPKDSLQNFLQTTA